MQPFQIMVICADALVHFSSDCPSAFVKFQVLDSSLPKPSNCLTEDLGFKSLLMGNFEYMDKTEQFIRSNRHQLVQASSLTPASTTGASTPASTTGASTPASTTGASTPASTTLVPTTTVYFDFSNDENHTDTQVILQNDADIHTTIVYDQSTINVEIQNFLMSSSKVESMKRIQTYYGQVLLLCHFKCLMPEVMLNDEVINMYAKLLSNNYGNDKMFILNALTSTKLSNLVPVKTLSDQEKAAGVKETYISGDYDGDEVHRFIGKKISNFSSLVTSSIFPLITIFIGSCLSLTEERTVFI
jgi:hypothetical protein